MIREDLFITESVLDLRDKRTYFKLSNFSNNLDVHLKLEGLNPAGSIKIKAALGMIEALEAQNKLIPGKHTVIESSSGNLGVALSLVAKMKGYSFICISDPNINKVTEKYIKLYGGKLIIVDQRDENGGYLGTRIKLINELIANNKDWVWLNQYASVNNVMSHYYATANEIFSSFSHVDYLFVGVGTSGTIMGCAHYIKKHNLTTKLIGIDALGSVSFGFSAKKRLIPGIGTSRKPEILNKEFIDEVILVAEDETIKMCRYILEHHALLIGGSTGSVLAGIQAYTKNIAAGATVVAISPDLGDKYLDTIYNDSWVNEHYPHMQITQQKIYEI